MAHSAKHRASTGSGASGSTTHSMVKERIEQLHAKFAHTSPTGSGYRSLSMSAESDRLDGGATSAEVATLTEEVRRLKRELRHANDIIAELESREQMLRDRLSEQAKKQVEKSGKFENLNLGENRPTALIRRYGNLYTQTRVDALDALDGLTEITEFDDLKGKLLFSIIVLAFRSVNNRIHDLKSRLRELLTGGSMGTCNAEDTGLQSVEHSVFLFLRRNMNKFDLSLNVQEVGELVWTTLFDFPSLQHCQGLKSYIKECVHLAWALSVQNPPILIYHDLGPFNSDMFERFHSSDPEGEEVKMIIWPALLEDDTGQCLYKGVAVT